MNWPALDWVVIAWVDTEAIHNGEELVAGNPWIQFIPVERLIPRAVVWCPRGGDPEEAAARAYISKNVPEARVFRFPPKEKDPLGHAKRKIVELELEGWDGAVTA